MSGNFNVLMAGGQLPVATGNAAFAADTENSPGDPVATVNFNSAGTQTGIGNGSLSSFTWLLSGAASAYDIRFSGSVTGTAVLSGSALSPSWHNLGTTRFVSLTKNTVGVASFSGTYDIAYTGTTTPIATGSLALNIEKVI